MIKYNKNRCLVNVSNSVLQNFNVPTFHPSLKELDEKLKGKKKIALMLFDGMGTYLINEHLKEDSFLRKHLLTRITSTFPPTTVAATNALLSGRFPNETGWMAWSQYFKDINQNLNVFINNDSYTGEMISDVNLMSELCHYDNIINLINKQHKKIKAKQIFQYPIGLNGPKTLDEYFTQVKDALTNGVEFVYAYWTDPDHTIHQYGVKSKEVHKVITTINKKVEKFHKEHPDITLVVLADHGLIDVDNLYATEHPDLIDTLKVLPCYEKRCPGFFIKEGREKEFEELFTKYYGDKFYLLNKQNIRDNHMFGPGEFSPQAEYFLADYMAIAKDKYFLYFVNEEHPLIGHHGGITKEEYTIDLMVVEGE